MAALALAGPAAASASTGGGAMPSSGAGSAAQASTSTGAPGATGTTGGAGVTAPPALIQIHEAIWAGDRIRFKPYIYAGGHGKWNDAGYDCSGSVSFVLHAAGLLKVSMDSSEFESWGRRGLGQWITVYTNPGHAFIEIAGIRFDTSAVLASGDD